MTGNQFGEPTKILIPIRLSQDYQSARDEWKGNKTTQQGRADTNSAEYLRRLKYYVCNLFPAYSHTLGQYRDGT